MRRPEVGPGDFSQGYETPDFKVISSFAHLAVSEIIFAERCHFRLRILNC